jgi:hypothetical protein
MIERAALERHTLDGQNGSITGTKSDLRYSLAASWESAEIPRKRKQLFSFSERNLE